MTVLLDHLTIRYTPPPAWAVRIAYRLGVAVRFLGDERAAKVATCFMMLFAKFEVV